MGLDIWIWMWGNPFLGAFEVVGPEISTFLGPNGTLYASCHFRAHPLKRPLLWIFPPSKSNPYIPPHINIRYINSCNTGRGGGEGVNQRED
jgi:hypothetical protein